jgi:hypothetical protein
MFDTSNALNPLQALGVTPKPKFPEELIRIDSVPPTEKAMVSAAGKKIPVFVSPLVVNVGNAAFPALNVRDTPDAIRLPDTLVSAIKFLPCYWLLMLFRYLCY